MIQYKPNKNYKKLAWREFSKYIRLRDCLETTGEKDRGICVTCGRKFGFKELQAGHCVSGRGNAILLDPNAVHIQCGQCNIFKKGNLGQYALYMIDTYGRGLYEDIIKLSKQPKTMKGRDWYCAYLEWKEKAEGLEKL